MSKIIKIIILGITISLLLLVTGHLFLQHGGTLSKLWAHSQYHWANICCRLMLYISLYCLWPHLISHLARRQAWHSDVVNYLKKQRIKLVGLFVIIEVFFVYNLIGHILNLLH